MALVTKLSEEEMLTNPKTWEIIGKNLGDDERGKIMERLVEKYPETSEFNQKAREIASFLMIKNVVGEVKMTDLESKNPQLKELGDFVYGRAPETSPRSARGTSSEHSPSHSRE
jgi:DNA-binding transcriptional ArsR family regulator